jgi:pimeloyl-ACP methyl ester carboxylesterase
LAIPPPAVIFAQRNLLPGQALLSWYILVNQLPFIPEMTFDSFIAYLWKKWSPGYDPSQDLAHVRDALPDRAHRSAALGYYRALQPWRHRRELGEEQRAVDLLAPQPTLYLHGKNDGCFRSDFVRGAQAVLPPGSVANVLDGCGHFLQLERAPEVNSLIASFLDTDAVAPSRAAS